MTLFCFFFKGDEAFEACEAAIASEDWSVAWAQHEEYVFFPSKSLFWNVIFPDVLQCVAFEAYRCTIASKDGTATHCNTYRCTIASEDGTATHCNTYRCTIASKDGTATHCNTYRCTIASKDGTATHCNTYRCTIASEDGSLAWA